MKNIEERIQELIEPIIVNLGYELYDVEYTKDGKDYFLRVYIDNDKGISLEDCEKVSNAINDIIDTEDFIKEQLFGFLQKFDKDYIYLKMEEKTLQIDRKNIAQIKTVYNWN